jgi:hypothetical protein
MKLTDNQRYVLDLVDSASNDRRLMGQLIHGDGNFRRTLRSLTEKGLIERTSSAPYFGVTTEGRKVLDV